MVSLADSRQVSIDFMLADDSDEDVADSISGNAGGNPKPEDGGGVTGGVNLGFLSALQKGTGAAFDWRASEYDI